MALQPPADANTYIGLIDRIEAEMYPRIADLSMEVWMTREPTPFGRRTEGTHRVVAVGDAWGRQLFDCAWFKFTGKIPPKHKGPFALRIDVNGELCLFGPTGIPVRGLTAVRSEYDRSLGGPAKLIYRLDEDAFRANTPVEIWADAGLNDLFGRITNGGKIEFAQICTIREDVRGLYYDFDFLRDWALALPEGDAFRARVFAAAKSLETLLKRGFDKKTVAAARALLAPLFKGDGHPASRLRLSGIGHAHMDLAWLWPIRETKRKCARTFATALYNIARNREYIFSASQPQQFEWMRENYPKLFTRIKRAVRSGRIEPLGRMWVEPDCNLTNGESLVRQVVVGERWFRETFGKSPVIAWIPDAFGFNGQLPQILKKSGHEAFVTMKLAWNLFNPFPHHSFQWQGVDGTRILTHMLPEGTYNSSAGPRTSIKIDREYREKNVSQRALVTFGIGDGGGGPDAEHLERIRRYEGTPLAPVECMSAENFLKIWRKDADKFPVYKGELYLERHQGTLTTQGRTKRNHRKTEVALHEAELWAAMAHTLCNAAYPYATFEAIWREFLLYQFHDILPGSSIRRVYDESNARFLELRAQLETLSRNALALLMAHTDRAPRMVFNALGWPRTEWIHADGADYRVSVPAFGWAPLPEKAEIANGALRADAKKRVLENSKLRATFARDGALVSLFLKAERLELIAKGESANRFVIYEDKGDAWDFPQTYLSQPSRSPKLAAQTFVVNGARAQAWQTYQIGESQIRQTIWLDADGDLLHFQTDVEWREPLSMLRVRFPSSVKTDRSRAEIAFGSIERPTGEDNAIDKARIEVSAHQWADLSNPLKGLALLNDCKYGHRLKGRTLDLCLIRSVPHPGFAFVNKDDAGKCFGAPVSDLTDIGAHRFDYALWPHAGTPPASELSRRARAFNAPLRVLNTEGARAEGARMPATFSALGTQRPAVEIATVKCAEDGDGLIARMVNLDKTPTTTKISACFAPVSACETDLLEHNGDALDVDGKSITVALAPLEIKTVRLRP